MGWYHSHPFDVGIHSHCYLSQTDISTQLQWQRAEDPHGNPFLAIVVDPLRSLAKNHPEMKAFRAYPPDFTNPIANQCPDGSIIHEEQARLELWGSCWQSYYELEVEYFMSGGARNVMALLTKNFLWMRTLGTSGICEKEKRERYPERVGKAAERIGTFETASDRSAGNVNVAGISGNVLANIAAERGNMDVQSSSAGGTRGSRGASSSAKSNVGVAGGSSTAGGGGGARGGASGGGKSSSTAGGAEDEDGGELGKACQAVVEIATEKLLGNIAQISKRELFS